MSTLRNVVSTLVFIGLVVTALLWFPRQHPEPDAERPVIAEDPVDPGSIADMVNGARLWAAHEYGVPQEMVYFEGLHFPYTSILPDDVNHAVFFIDAESFEVTDDETHRVTSYRTLQVSVDPDGTLRRHGESWHRARAPLPVSQSTGEVRPYRPHPNEPFLLRDLDYQDLALEALQAENLPLATRERLIPATLTAAYKPYETRMERTPTLFLKLFDPYDIPQEGGGINLQVESYNVLINPEGKALFRGRTYFGSMPRLERIRDLLIHAPAPE